MRNESAMNSLQRLFGAIASILLVLSPDAFALGGDYEPGETLSHPGTWPPRLVALGKLPSRVAGYFVNQDDYIAFKGDTAGFRASSTPASHFMSSHRRRFTSTTARGTFNRWTKQRSRY